MVINDDSFPSDSPLTHPSQITPAYLTPFPIYSCVVVTPLSSLLALPINCFWDISSILLLWLQLPTNSSFKSSCWCNFIHPKSSYKTIGIYYLGSSSSAGKYMGFLSKANGFEHGHPTLSTYMHVPDTPVFSALGVNPIHSNGTIHSANLCRSGVLGTYNRSALTCRIDRILTTLAFLRAEASKHALKSDPFYSRP